MSNLYLIIQTSKLAISLIVSLQTNTNSLLTVTNSPQNRLMAIGLKSGSFSQDFLGEHSHARSGHVGDLYGRKKALLLSISGVAVSSILIGFVNTLALKALARSQPHTPVHHLVRGALPGAVIGAAPRRGCGALRCGLS